MKPFYYTGNVCVVQSTLVQISTGNKRTALLSIFQINFENPTNVESIKNKQFTSTIHGWLWQKINK